MNTKSKGALAESIVCDCLVSRGYKIIDRNYSRKWGELDIVALKKGTLHFVEVKSDFRLQENTGYRPEEQVHNLKQRKLRRIISTYLVERKWGLDCSFVFDVAIVTFRRIGKGDQYSIILHENIII
jgi:putative endonuclease